MIYKQKNLNSAIMAQLGVLVIVYAIYELWDVYNCINEPEIDKNVPKYIMYPYQLS